MGLYRVRHDWRRLHSHVGHIHRFLGLGCGHIFSGATMKSTYSDQTHIKTTSKQKYFFAFMSYSYLEMNIKSKTIIFKTYIIVIKNDYILLVGLWRGKLQGALKDFNKGTSLRLEGQTSEQVTFKLTINDYVRLSRRAGREAEKDCSSFKQNIICKGLEMGICEWSEVNEDNCGWRVLSRGSGWAGAEVTSGRDRRIRDMET